MCDFLSFFIVGTKNGLAVIPTDNLCEHSERSYLNSLTGIGSVCEAEWTSPDTKDLSVRLPNDQKDNKQRDWFLANYPSRAALIKSFCGMFENKINGDITIKAEEKDLDWLSGLSVGGSLYLRNTQITKLPDGLSVGGYLDLRNTQITKADLPKKFQGKAIF